MTRPSLFVRMRRFPSDVWRTSASPGRSTRHVTRSDLREEAAEPVVPRRRAVRLERPHARERVHAGVLPQARLLDVVAVTLPALVMDFLGVRVEAVHVEAADVHAAALALRQRARPVRTIRTPAQTRRYVKPGHVQRSTLSRGLHITRCSCRFALLERERLRDRMMKWTSPPPIGRRFTT